MFLRPHLVSPPRLGALSTRLATRRRPGWGRAWRARVEGRREEGSVPNKLRILNFRATFALFFFYLLWKTLFFYSFIWADVKLTHAKSLTTLKFQGLKRQMSSLERNTLF